MRIVVGLGNPGAEYEGTRHNAGFMALDALTARTQVSWTQDAAKQALRAETTIDGERVILLKPLTYMNRSGDALAMALDACADTAEPTAADVLVITDDIHLPPGRMRLRARGSSGGHNGLASVETALASTEYPRLRIGVGGDDAPDRVAFVLGRFTPEETAVLAEVLPAASEVVRAWVTADDLQAVQAQANGWRSSLERAPEKPDTGNEENTGISTDCLDAEDEA